MRLLFLVSLCLPLHMTSGQYAPEPEPANFNVTEALVKNGVNISPLPTSPQRGVAALVRFANLVNIIPIRTLPTQILMHYNNP